MMNTIKSTKIDPNESMHSCVVADETSCEHASHQPAAQENKNGGLVHGDQISDHLKTIITHNVVRSVERGEAVESSRIAIEKYPGFIHVAVDSLERLCLDADSMVSLHVVSDNHHSTTPKHYPNDFIKLRHYFKVAILNRHQKMVKLRFEVIEHRGPEARCLFEAESHVSSSDITGIHNKLVEKRVKLLERRPLLSRIFKFIGRGQRMESPVCKCYFSYLSSSEFRDLACAPDSLGSLSKWIIYRRPAFEILFEGVLTVKYDKFSPTWDKRHVVWIGYLIFVFDLRKKKLIRVIDLSDGEPSLEMIHMNIIIFRIDGKLCGIECNTAEGMRECMEATYKIFPKIIEWI